MAYVSHSGSNKSSQYDWKILIFMVILLVSILVFVAFKFLYPNIVGAPAVPTGVVSPPAMAGPTSSSTTSAVLVPKQNKSATIATPKSVDAVTADESKNSELNTTDNALKSELLVEPNKTQSTDTLLCSDKDRAAGLCQ